ncbi:MAG: transglutaminase domain-containing protein, partial [Myxococcota bacterium]
SISGRGGKGTNENLEFQDNYDSSGNQAPVAVVLFHDDYSSPTGVYYFRQGAFSQYNGRRLVQSTLPSADRDIALRFPTVRAVDPSDAPDEDAARQPVETTVALLSDHIRPFGLEAPVSFGPASNPDPARFKRTYTVSSLSMSRGYFDLLFSPLGNPEWSDAERAHYLDAPEDRRYRELAESIIEEALPAHLRALPLARAFAVAKWLGEKGVYSLRSDHAQAADPTAHFLFGDLKGYCVHFAHAGTYLLRTLGIAARVATGYAVSESARHGGSALLLSGANSHAWPEVYVDGFGWLVLDIQPQSTLDPPPSAPDPELQRLLGELARGLHPLPVEGMRSFSELKDSAAGFAKTAAMLLGISLGIAALIMVFIKSYRRLIPGIAKDRDQPRLAYRRELDRLSEHGLSRLRGETREGFALRVAAIAPSFRNLTRVHLEATFGRAGDHLGNGARQSADAVRAEIRAAFPRFRRWFGLIRFWSFLRSR